MCRYFSIMQSIIQQQHVKRRRVRAHVSPKKDGMEGGFRSQAEKMLAGDIFVGSRKNILGRFAPKAEAVSISRRGWKTGYSNFRLNLETFIADLGLAIPDATMLISIVAFLFLLVIMQGVGGLPGTWVADRLRPEANIGVVEHIIRSELEKTEGSLVEYPVELDLSRFELLSFSEYTMEPGDTLSGVAQRYNLRMDTLVSFNKITDVRRMQIGESLQIPNRNGLRHVVRRGESLNSVADRYAMTTTEIIDANNLRSQTLSIGQELFIPDARMNDTDLKMVLGELFVYPVRGRFTSGFGYRNDPFTGVRRFHNGIDIANAAGTRILAARVGRVVDVGRHSGYGNYVIVSHDGGFQSLYAHLSEVLVQRGQRVSQGQRLGSMGSTGRSTGSHLHFSIFHNGNPVDPLRYLH
ncbi:MAG: M23 family metallopeptidase [Spirochaetaceae bacterium]|nr:MAG: M23 family metallopeptidase [Spirochaetaceae bacterium]